MNRAAHRLGSVVEDQKLNGGRERRLQRRKHLSDVVDDLDRVGSRLPGNRKEESAGAIVPGNRFVVFNTVDDVREFLEPQGNALPPFDDERPVGRRFHQLPARLHRERLLRTAQPACRQIHVALLHRTLHFIDSHLMRGKPVRIDLDPYRIFLGAKNLHPRNSTNG